LSRVLAGLFLMGALGTAAELVLLDHTGEAWQLVPLVLLVAGAAMLLPLAFVRSTAAGRAFQVLMILFVLSGIVGVGLHYWSNLEFERELQTEATGLALVWDALKGGTPSLAPGTMVLLGGLGLAYSFSVRE
jgi:hypothetical protein